jgi:hypothetical protein
MSSWCIYLKALPLAVSVWLWHVCWITTGAHEVGQGHHSAFTEVEWIQDWQTAVPVVLAVRGRQQLYVVQELRRNHNL